MIRRLLIANRGEIAIRISRTAREKGIGVVTTYPADDRNSAHVGFGDVAHELSGTGAAAYLDITQIVDAARLHGCDAVHPGYGFLSENAELARACADAGIVFIGPSSEILELFGDKTRARALAQQCGVPVIEGTAQAVTLEEAQAFFARQGTGGAVMLKAVAGGGGRGMRAVEAIEDLPRAFARCQSEALRSFGQDAIYAERFIRNARHIEVQIVGDGTDVVHLWERDCTLQRQNQKLVEIAPAPGLPPALRATLLDAACSMANAARYRTIGTFEFLIDAERIGDEDAFFFIEANPRLQVEHTVTEEVVGRDLVALQLDIAGGFTLADLKLTQTEIGNPRGFAMQLRINMESMDANGAPRPSSGTIAEISLPGGLGVRVDTFGYAGYQTSSRFDSLLAKLVVHTPDDFAATVRRARRALGEFRITGLSTNIPFLEALLARPEVATNAVTTGFVMDHIGEILATVSTPSIDRPAVAAVRARAAAVPLLEAANWVPLPTPTTGVLASVSVIEGDAVVAGAELAVIEAMKMEHVLRASVAGIVRAIMQQTGGLIGEGEPILFIEPADVANAGAGTAVQTDPDHIRDDLCALRERLAVTLDAGRPTARDRRHARGQRTVRENLADLLDADSFIEYGQLAVANRHMRHGQDELRAISPADGFVMGLATVNADCFGAPEATIAVGAYDATVFAGTQGKINHEKTDRLFDIAGERGVPLVLFAEGGGGRPGDDPSTTVAGLGTPSFFKLAKLSGKVPVVGIASGRCFAGNAALLGLCDVIIATEDIAIGMGGPSLIEAAGLGVFTPEQVGNADVHSKNGVIDVRVADEAAAVTTAKQYLSYFQGNMPAWHAADPRLLRNVIPVNRLRAYDVRDAGRLIADTDSWLELRPDFGRAYVTALARIAGRPMGMIANNPLFNAGAIDSDGADKAARFLKLCNAHGLPVLTLIDTPGIMVGPEAEKTGLVRHAARLFATAAAIEVPLFAVVLRKAYGLGAMAAAGGHFHRPSFTVAWPTGELGGMGIEGGVRLGHKQALEAIPDPAERQAYFDARVAAQYERGKAASVAAFFELDAVIDPADTRKWILRGLDAAGGRVRPSHGFIDTW